MTVDLDRLEALTKEHLVQCGPCDFGLVEYSCTCPKGDPRHVISQLAELIAEVRDLRAVAEAARAWKSWHPYADSMFVPENALMYAVAVLDAKEKP